MSDLGLLATTLHVSDRTLRRAAARGTIRCVRHSERRTELPIEEALYLERRWPLLEAILAELRTIPSARLVVLFGSAARGDESTDSDIDLLVRFGRRGLAARAHLLARLEHATGREIQIVELEDANPVLLEDVIRDGRVLADRDGEWQTLLAAGDEIRARAEVARTSLDIELWRQIEELLSEAGTE